MPNFDEAEPPFTVRHGEYRITSLEENGTSKVKNLSGPWSNIETSSTWNFYETGVDANLSIVSLSDETIARPGFHPYFSSRDDELVSIDAILLQYSKRKLRMVKRKLYR